MHRGGQTVLSIHCSKISVVLLELIEGKKTEFTLNLLYNQ